MAVSSSRPNSASVGPLGEAGPDLGQGGVGDGGGGLDAGHLAVVLDQAQAPRPGRSVATSSAPGNQSAS